MISYIDFAKNIIKSNFGRLRFPYKLTYAVTYRCNYKCKTCNIWKYDSKNELTLDEIKEFFKVSNKFNWIDLTGGEVWLRKDFVEIVETVINQCKNLILLHFPTNAYMTKQIIDGVKQIMKMRPPRLMITCSMDGDEALNDDIRGIKGGWQRQIETYKQLREISGVHVFLGMTLSSYNSGQYGKAFEAAKKECPWLKPTDFHMNIAHESPHYYGNSGNGVVCADTVSIIRQVHEYKNLRGHSIGPTGYLESRYLNNVDSYLEKGITPMKCHALHSSCFIDPYGDVYPCAMYDAKVASLRDCDFDLKSIWESEKAKKLQSEIWQYKCSQCWTPCEAYQSIFGNLLGTRSTPDGKS